jgi:CTP synthase (UTP-ammonia lyase)
MTSIAILGEYQPTSETHLATEKAIAHSNLQLKTKVEGIWVASKDINTSLFDHSFFMGTLFVPQVRSTPETPHPIVTTFLKVVEKRRSHLDSDNS